MEPARKSLNYDEDTKKAWHSLLDSFKGREHTIKLRDFLDAGIGLKTEEVNAVLKEDCKVYLAVPIMTIDEERLESLMNAISPKGHFAAALLRSRPPELPPTGMGLR